MEFDFFDGAKLVDAGCPHPDYLERDPDWPGRNKKGSGVSFKPLAPRTEGMARLGCHVPCITLSSNLTPDSYVAKSQAAIQGNAKLRNKTGRVKQFLDSGALERLAYGFQSSSLAISTSAT